MSYTANETGQESSQPIKLYTFTRGTETWRYVARTQGFTASGDVYAPEVISVGNMAQTGSVPKDAIDITLPKSNAVAASFLGIMPAAVTVLTIKQAHVDEPNDSIVEWTGRVVKANATVATVRLTCESPFAAVKRTGLRQMYSRLCRYRFGGDGCFVDILALKAVLAVQSVAGAMITLPTAPSTNYEGGLFGLLGTGNDLSDMRTVIRQEGAVLYLSRPAISLLAAFAAHPEGFNAAAIPGCNRSVAACVSHGNLGNFGGFPGIPYLNPVNQITSVF
jgi:hypothetical protein